MRMERVLANDLCRPYLRCSCGNFLAHGLVCQMLPSLPGDGAASGPPIPCTGKGEKDGAKEAE